MLRKFLITILFVFYNSFVFASDEKPGRFFEDQPDVTDQPKVHFSDSLRFRLMLSNSIRYR